MEKKGVPFDSCCVVNLLDRELSTNEKAVLKKGLNFAVTPRRVPVDDIIAGVEGGLHGLSGPEVEEAHLKMF